MVAKILNSSGSFNAVKYNSNKINKGVGELMSLNNMDSSGLSNNPNQNVVREYLKAFSNTNKRVKNPQFHATISAKENEYNKFQLTDIAHSYLKKMGYEKQPYIIIFHNDTDNNHVHIVSTRVDINGRKISDSFEKIRSQKAIQEVMNEKYNISEKVNLDKLLSYKYTSEGALTTLLEKNSFKIGKKDDSYHFFKGGVLISKLEMMSPHTIDFITKSALKQKLLSYAKTYDNVLSFNNGAWSSEATEKLKKSLGIDIVFHHKGERDPFGYTIIDNNNKFVSKGGEILKLKEFLEPELIPGYSFIQKIADNDIPKKEGFIDETIESSESISIGELINTNSILSGEKGRLIDSNIAKVLSSIHSSGQNEQGDDQDDEYKQKRKKGRRR